MNIRNLSRLVLSAAIALPFSQCVAQQSGAATLTIDPAQIVTPVSQTLYGLMTEEINDSYDGGLYAEMVRNRTFRADWSGIVDWLLLEKGKSAASMSVDSGTGPGAALSTSLKVEIHTADAHNPAGVLNDGYWGMTLRANTTYRGSFYAKSTGPDAVTARLVNNTSGVVLADAVVSGIGGDWKRYDFVLKTSAAAAGS